VKREWNVGLVLSALSAAVVLLLAWWAQGRLGGYLVRLVHMWGIYVIFVVSFNLIYGYTGQFSLAHAGLTAIGAYTVALLTLSPGAKQAMFLLVPPTWPISVVQWPFFPALVLSGLLAAVVGFGVGAPALRLRGDYLLIVTLGFSEIIRLLLAALPTVSNGALGLVGIPTYTNLVWVWACAMAAIFVTKRLVDSSYGRALKCIREDEIAAEAMGVRLYYHKLMAFTISAFFTGIGGALLANLLRTVDPRTFAPSLSYVVITMAVLGGVDSLTGAVLAAGIYTVMSEILRVVESPITLLGIHVRGFPGLRTLAFAVMLLLLIRFYRKGLMGGREFSWHSASVKLRGLTTAMKGKGGEE